jgi:ethanolamine utilization protein EutQ (cupin superfamily)
VIICGQVTFSSESEEVVAKSGDVVFVPAKKKFSVTCQSDASVIQTFFGPSDFIFCDEK